MSTVVAPTISLGSIFGDIRIDASVATSFDFTTVFSVAE